MSARRTPEHDLERLLDGDRGEFGALYDRLSRAEPPRRLDRAVLAEASRAVLGRAPRSQRWMLGLGSAAGIVLAAGIAWQVGRQVESRDAAPAADSARSAPLVVPVQPITPREPQAEPSSSAAAPAEPAAQNAAGIKSRSDADTRARRAAAAPPPAAALPPKPVAAAAPAEVAAEQPERDAEAFVADAAKDLPMREQPAASAAAMADHAAVQESVELRSKAVGGAARRERGAAAGPPPLTSVQLRNNMQLAPQDWLAEIVRLKREGRRQQAIENLRLFRRMHPDWQLSDELRQLSE